MVDLVCDEQIAGPIHRYAAWHRKCAVNADLRTAVGGHLVNLAAPIGDVYVAGRVQR